MKMYNDWVSSEVSLPMCAQDLSLDRIWSKLTENPNQELVTSDMTEASSEESIIADLVSSLEKFPKSFEHHPFLAPPSVDMDGSRDEINFGHEYLPNRARAPTNFCNRLKGQPLSGSSLSHCSSPQSGNILGSSISTMKEKQYRQHEDTSLQLVSSISSQERILGSTLAVKKVASASPASCDMIGTAVKKGPRELRALRRREFHKIHTRRSRAKLNDKMETLLSVLPAPPPGTIIKSKAQILDYAISVLTSRYKVVPQSEE